jgi:putative phosphoesterase
MRIIVISDTHGHESAMEAIYQTHPNAQRYIHLGDGAHDIAVFRQRHPYCDLYSVKGNSDFSSGDPDRAEMEIAGKRNLYTHGHTFFVKHGLQHIREYARRQGYDIVLFGHTHTPLYDYADGIHFLNPGSDLCADRYRFGIVDITKNGVVCVSAEIERKAEK